MKELIEMLVKQLAQHKDQVVVTEEVSDGVVNVSVTIHPQDMGPIIGKGGRVINAIRTVARAKATLEDVKVYVEVQDNTGQDR